MPQSLKTTGGSLAPQRFPIMPARQNFALGNFPVLTASQWVPRRRAIHLQWVVSSTDSALSAFVRSRATAPRKNWPRRLARGVSLA